MRSISLHQSIEVVYKKVEDCPLKNLKLTFFQLVYIVEGSGTINVNGNVLDYRKGNLMLLTPNDYYHFNIGVTTEFLLIRFNKGYLKEYKWKTIDHIECLLHYANHLSGCIIRCENDAFLVRSIAVSILHGLNNDDIYNEDLLLNFVNALLVIAARNIAKIKPTGIQENADKRVQEIIQYIQDNIFCPSRLKACEIAKQFDISATYLGSYFKNQCGETIQHYIAGYKLRLIEHRLKFSDMRINEIVAEFGFSDESHLNKFFKKYRSISLTAYRKKRA